MKKRPDNDWSEGLTIIEAMETKRTRICWRSWSWSCQACSWSLTWHDMKWQGCIGGHTAWSGAKDKVKRPKGPQARSRVRSVLKIQSSHPLQGHPPNDANNLHQTPAFLKLRLSFIPLTTCSLASVHLSWYLSVMGSIRHKKRSFFNIVQKVVDPRGWERFCFLSGILDSWCFSGNSWMHTFFWIVWV